MTTKSWKSLIFTDAEESTSTVSKANTNEVKEATKFPTTTVTNQFDDTKFKPTPNFTPTYTPTQGPNHEEMNKMCEPHLSKFVDMYEKGFISLNMAGYDFFEFFQAVMTAGADNPQIYAMAMTMGQAMDKSVTKEKLLADSNFYLTEIAKVYNSYVTTGTAKKNEVILLKETENKNLVAEVDNMKQQVEHLQQQIRDREERLASINEKFAPQLNEIDCKLMANDFAKNKLTSAMDKVINGIKNYIK